ncbi:hypothetical protein GP486_008337 [Trichoglossum hirsutum]|uniref:C2H2-type domain-containing protein n=1 Tax=Trichoglossum hirsutum TaxID=265104 RepID=A0A9P8L1U8_9PEZI|nr:hypothetical protein GP486_008337 [Trichoglossum hirsutum]
MAAVAAAVKEAGDAPFAVPMPPKKAMVGRGNTGGFRTLDQSPPGGGPEGYPSPPSSLPNNPNGYSFPQKSDFSAAHGSAIVDGNASSDASLLPGKSRMRRASEGAHAIKGESKRASGSELRCEKCGKGYKHSSCLTKHLWEHTPEWSYTSKLLISKHQQVQLLEAASVLVSMNQEDPTPPGSAKDISSDHSSTSPAASGSSGLHDGLSSADTTPPPQPEGLISPPLPTKISRNGRPKRYSSNSSTFSRSYQSAPSNPSFPGSAPTGSTGFSLFQSSVGTTDYGPETASSVFSGSGMDEEDEASLAAAVELLSCSFGTPASGPVLLPLDVPPVPPLPARFMSSNFQSLSESTPTPTNHQPEAEVAHDYLRQRREMDGDIAMEHSEESAVDDDDYDRRSTSKGRSEDDDDGVFGRMEE